MELLLMVYGTLKWVVGFWIEVVLLPFKLPLSGLCLWLAALRWFVNKLPLVGDYLFDNARPIKSRSPSLEERVIEKRDFRKRAHSFCNCDVTGKRSTRQKNLSDLRRMLVENQFKTNHGNHLFPEHDPTGTHSAGPSPKLHRRPMRHSMQEGLSGTIPKISITKDQSDDYHLDYQAQLLAADLRGGNSIFHMPHPSGSPPTSDTEPEAEPSKGRIPRHSSPDIHKFRRKSGEEPQKNWKEYIEEIMPLVNGETPRISVDESRTEQLEEEKSILQLRLAEAERKNEALEEALLEQIQPRSPKDYTLPDLNDSFQTALDANMNAEENLRLTASTEFEMATC